jgi:hypothetical protein
VSIRFERPRVLRCGRRGPWIWSLISVALALGSASCGTQQAPITPADTAQAALEAALGAWREGRAPNALMNTQPPILVADSEWTGGRKLTEYRIVREDPSPSDRRFTVALRYEGTDSDSEVPYIVIGTDPVSVFREDDYQRALNMDNNPSAPPGRAR